MADKQAGDLYVDIQSSTQGATKSLNNIIKKLEKLQTTLNGIDTTNLSKMTSELNFGSVGKGRSQNSKNGAFGFLNIARWGAIYYGAKRFGRVMSDIAQSGADYTETLNLWQTAMGDNLTLATEFVNKMNEAYGISEKTLMNAQATFKNMLGGLGNITDQMAYALSEGITQMAVDYASLYNQTFEQAFTKFEAALAGQVRPIRSVSGYDITENTIYQLYQSLGGEKTMRQLNRTEKQLLQILAIFQQMSATGAVGDLNKTMNTFANQSRVMAESWQQVVSYAGVLLTYTIQESGLLTYVNAILIFIGDVLKAVAENLGAIQSFADPFQAVTDGALTASEATDQLNGKLLDFDKFRSLSGGAEDNVLGLDERLLQAFSNFDSILANANMEARNLAKSWKVASGLFDENEVFDVEKWNEIWGIIKSIGITLGIVFGVKTVDIIITFTKRIFTLKNAMSILNLAIIGGIVYSIFKMVEAFDQGDIWGGILAGTIGVGLVGAFVLLHKKAIASALLSIGKFISTLLVMNTVAMGSALGGILALTGAFIGLGSAIFGAFAIFSSWSDMNSWQRIIGIIGVATTAILGLAMAFGAFHSAWSLGLASAGIAAGIAMIVASIATVKKDIGSVSTSNVSIPSTSNYSASSMGANINYTPTSTTSTMSANNMKSAVYQALVEYGSTQRNNGNETTIFKIGEDEVFRATRKSAKRQGLDFVKV